MTFKLVKNNFWCKLIKLASIVYASGRVEKIEKLQENGWFVRDGLEWHLEKGETNIIPDTARTIIPINSVSRQSTSWEALLALTFAPRLTILTCCFCFFWIYFNLELFFKAPLLKVRF